MYLFFDDLRDMARLIFDMQNDVQPRATYLATRPCSGDSPGQRKSGNIDPISLCCYLQAGRPPEPVSEEELQDRRHIGTALQGECVFSRRFYPRMKPTVSSRLSPPPRYALVACAEHRFTRKCTVTSSK